MSCAPLFRDFDCGLSKQSAATEAGARSETVDSQNPETTKRCLCRFKSVSDLAREIGLDPSFAARLLRLTLLAPDIVESILICNEPSGLSLTNLTRVRSPIWEEQRMGIRPGRGARPDSRPHKRAYRRRRIRGVKQPSPPTSAIRLDGSGIIRSSNVVPASTLSMLDSYWIPHVTRNS
jgi:hypothetical protein